MTTPFDEMMAGLPEDSTKAWDETDYALLVISLKRKVPLYKVIKILRETPRAWEFFRDHPEWNAVLNANVEQTIRGFFKENEIYRDDLHRALHLILEMDISSPERISVFNQDDPKILEIRHQLETAWERKEDGRIPTPSSLPEEPREFTTGFKKLVRQHEAADHALFSFLEESATREQMAYFLWEESTVDARFDDLVALTQIGMNGPMKMELAQNYWDEMGNGHPEQVHTYLFSTLLEELGVASNASVDKVDWQSLACGNLLVYLASRRKHVYKALGALGATEMLSPKRFKRLVHGFKRLGLSEAALVYHTEHIGIDTRHGNGWLRNAIEPAVTANPQVRYQIVQGAFYRLHTSLDYCNRLYALYTGGFLAA